MQIKTALISVYSKEKLDIIAYELLRLNVHIFSSGGTYNYLKSLQLKGLQLTSTEELTGFPSILGGRVKTLHPKIFGGILSNREVSSNGEECNKYAIPEIDLVIVDLYPFEKTVATTSDEQAIIEKIDIGGISLIRAAAKNYKGVLIVPSFNQYDALIALLKEQNGEISLAQRKTFAAHAFNISSHYDTAIFNYYNQTEDLSCHKSSITKSSTLRYGENPHQKALFYGELENVFEQLHGRALSYNNLGDLDAAIQLIMEFEDTNPTFAILKHNNACGLAIRNTLLEAWNGALACDPISAFGGVLITNKPIDEATATEINKLFFEIILAPDYSPEALTLLTTKKNRIILKKRAYHFPKKQHRTLLNGVLEQDKDLLTESADSFTTATKAAPTKQELADLHFANIVVKHTKSNAIVLAKDGQLFGSGTGQTSRVDALRQAINKAKAFNFNLQDAVMASDAFFPFADCVEIAQKEGINAVIQPGGSIRDKDSIAFCDEHKMAMVFTGNRHFKH